MQYPSPSFRYVLVAIATLMCASAAWANAWVADERPDRLTSPVADFEHPVTRDTLTDPVGDTFGTGPIQIDIIQLSADLFGTDLVINVDFNGTVSPPDSGLDDALTGLIDIDADQNGATGDVPWTDLLTSSNLTGMGNEFYVDLFSYSAGDGQADLVDDLSEMAVGRVSVLFGNDDLMITIPVALLSDDGAVNIATVLGTLAEPTDKAPNVGSVASEGQSTGNPEIARLRDGRFEVGIIWSFQPTVPFTPARVSNFRTDESAIFTFLNPDNFEFLIKVLDGCEINDHWWVFFAGATNVEYTLTITDTQSGQIKTYTNPLGHPADAITDTQAFATCP